MADQELDVSGKITPEGVARMRARIGVEVPQEDAPNEYASIDTIRHFAWGVGDDNPLWCDPEYARTTRWRSIMAPPTFAATAGVSEVKEIPPEVREKGAGALRGVHMFFAGESWEWYRPIFPGDRLVRKYSLEDVEEKKSEFAGHSVITRYRSVYVNDRGEVVAIFRNHYVHTERKASAERKKYNDVAPTEYTDEMLEEIDAAMERAMRERRGGTPRYWEDVQVGESLTPLVKGPLAISDIIGFMVGWANISVRPHEIRYQHRRKHPKFYSKNEFGAWDLVERVHWDPEFARKIGNPQSYDFGRMRSAWLAQLVTNWMGDDAWLWKMEDEMRRFNFIGDTTWVKGKVTQKYVTPEGDHAVDLEVWAENQRGEVTAPGRCSVMLPSRAGGSVLLPRGPRGIEGHRPMIP